MMGIYKQCHVTVTSNTFLPTHCSKRMVKLGPMERLLELAVLPSAKYDCYWAHHSLVALTQGSGLDAIHGFEELTDLFV